MAGLREKNIYLTECDHREKGVKEVPERQVLWLHRVSQLQQVHCTMYCICTCSVDSGLTRGGCDIITGAKHLRGGKTKRNIDVHKDNII